MKKENGTKKGWQPSHNLLALGNKGNGGGKRKFGADLQICIVQIASVGGCVLFIISNKHGRPSFFMSLLVDFTAKIKGLEFGSKIKRNQKKSRMLF